MERGSSKHSQHLDDDLAREAQSYLRGGPVSARDNEWRDSELVSDDQPEPQWLPEGWHPEGAPPGISGSEMEARSVLGRAVPRSALPGGRDDVLRGAEELGVTPQVRAELARLPDDDRVYHTVYEIWETLGHRNEEGSRQEE